MRGYRRGTVLGLTVAETFIVLTFLLLIALLGLTYRDEPVPESDMTSAPRVWERPEDIVTLVNAAEAARVVAERERDEARESAEEARRAREEVEAARVVAERERDEARESAEEARRAREEVEAARVVAERERDEARESAEEARRAQTEAEQVRATANSERDQANAQAEEELSALERERDEARQELTLFRRKGENPPCWYKVVSAGEGKEREKPYYAFNVAIYEHSIELAPRSPAPEGAFDDNGRSYAEEWKQLKLDELPYGKELSDEEFAEAVRDLVAKGRNGEVRSYECVFSVMVWDKTPVHAKKRWKNAHDRIIESSFSAYTVQDLEWKGFEPQSGEAEDGQTERFSR